MSVLFLQLATHEQIELLIGAAQFQVRLQRHGVIALHQWIQEFMHRYRDTALEASCEVFAFHHARNRIPGRQLDHAAGAERIAPFGVVADLGFCGIEHQACLRVVGFGVLVNLFRSKRRASGVAPTGIPDHGSEIANKENDGVTNVLQLAQFIENDCVA